MGVNQTRDLVDDSSLEVRADGGAAPDGGTAPVGNDAYELSLDAVLGALSHYQRRDALNYLSEMNASTATADELVDELVEREAVRRHARPDPDHVLMSLFHVHLPKLATLDVVEFDARSREIRYRGDAYLEKWLAYTVEDEWGEEQ